MSHPASAYRLMLIALTFLVVLAGCGAPAATVPPTAIPPTAAPPTTAPAAATPTNVPTPSPTLEPSPSPTATVEPTPSATPIPGIGAPITTNGVDVQVKSATFGGSVPIGTTLQPGFDVLDITLSLSGGNDFNTLFSNLNIRELRVVDEAGNESQVGFVNLTADALSDTTPPYETTLSFTVKEDAKVVTLHFPDGQTVDVTPVLKND